MTSALAKADVGRSTFTVEKTGDVSYFAALETEWNGLLQASASDCLFLTWEWLYTWWKHLAAGRQLCLFLVRRDEQLAAVAPFGLRRGRPLPVLEFLGSGNVGSDYLDFIVRRGCEDEAIAALVQSVAGERFPLNLTQLNRRRCFAAEIAEILAGSGWRASEAVTNVCPFIQLAGLSWDSYLAELGAEHRYNFRRKVRRLTEQFTVEFDEVRTETERREAIELVIHLHHMRWNERGGSDAFHTPELLSFHREMSRVALERGWLRLYVLRLDRRPVAALYGFLYRRTFYFYQSGFDPSFSKHSVGLVTMGLAIQNAIKEGALEYDLLHGDEDYKKHWALDRRELGRLELYPPGSLGWICTTSMTAKRGVKRLARRVLPGSVVRYLQS